MKQEISLAQQNYIEAIDELTRERGSARTTDLASKLNVSAPSVSEAVRRLVEQGIAIRKSWHEIVLSKRGQTIAVDLEKRHRTLRRFMTEFLNMGAREADEIACSVEHCISPGFADRLTLFADFLNEKMPLPLKTAWQRLA